MKAIKAERQKSRAYLEFIRDHPCCVCFNYPTDADHLTTRGAGGSDYTAIPLCRVHHAARHQFGLKKFEERFGVNCWREAFYFLNEYAGLK